MRKAFSCIVYILVEERDWKKYLDKYNNFKVVNVIKKQLETDVRDRMQDKGVS